MFRLNFRIATKLAMAGGVALLTVGAIALNQSWDRQARAELAAEADNADAVRVATLTAAVATRRVVIMGRDIRLAMSEPDVDDVLKRAGGFGAEGVKALETAAAMAATGHGRQRLEHAKEVTQKYTAAVGEVAAVRKEWLNVARTLEVGVFRRAFTIILPAAAPTILTGMRISIGIAWLVIVAAEMLVGGTGIGYFVWNEWNNLSITNVITAILVIGIVGMVLDQLLARVGRLVTFPE